MDGLCYQFLSGAALACSEDRAVGRADHFNHLEEFLHLVALPDEVPHSMNLPEFAAKIRVLLTQAPAFESAENNELQLFDEILRFEDVIVGAHLQGLNGS